MKPIVIFFIFTLCGINAFAQGGLHLIDSAAIVNWPSLTNNCAISKDGKYFMYTIEYNHLGTKEMIITDTGNSWVKCLADVDNGFFTANSAQFVFQSKDTLYFQSLGSDKIQFVSNVVSYKRSNSSKIEWLGFLLNSSNEGKLILLNMFNGNKREFGSVEDYSFDPTGQVLLLKTTAKEGNYDIQRLKWVDLVKGKSYDIWSANNYSQQSIKGYCFDVLGDQLAFITQEERRDDLNDHSKHVINTLWYFKRGGSRAIIKVENDAAGIDTGLFVGAETPSFNDNGQYIFFHLSSSHDDRKPLPGAVQVDVWTYRDSVLLFKQSQSADQSYLACIKSDSSKVIRLEHEDESFAAGKGVFGFLSNKNSIEEYWWPTYKQKSTWLISLRNGAHRLLDRSGHEFSPNGQYMVYYNYTMHHYCSYDFSSNTTRNISGSIPDQWLTDRDAYIPEMEQRPAIGVAGWSTDDCQVFVYDNYDIWKLNLKGKLAPVNITNGYGRAHHIKFRIVNFEGLDADLSNNSSILLTAYDIYNKYNGFFRVKLGIKENPEVLTMGPWTLCYGGPDVVSGDKYADDMVPLKAADAKVWVVRRQTASEAPNYFVSTDLRRYRPITNLQPQKSYNWLTTELITWKQLDGTMSQGVLYKPQNFDPIKRYPVLFEYYEEFSQNMYGFPIPDFADGRIDVPWYVSRGYLVFTPDIHYHIDSTRGKVRVVGDCVVNSIVSAFHYLAHLPYVDSKRMGIQGHSFGGAETMYLITHTHLFAAACAASSGISDEVSSYLGIIRANGKPIGSKLEQSETNHNNMGITLWQRPDMYIRSSPVFRANEVTTPLLIMHNLGDYACDWSQGVEMYIALRRLQKKVWMLQYDHGGHILSDQKDAIDYTLRMNQFFDFYLKGAAPPKWMTQGVPVRLKGIVTGYEPDTSGAQP